MSKQPTASAKPAPQLATPTDLGDNARADIAAVINTTCAVACGGVCARVTRMQAYALSRQMLPTTLHWSHRRQVSAPASKAALRSAAVW